VQRPRAALILDQLLDNKAAPGRRTPRRGSIQKGGVRFLKMASYLEEIRGIVSLQLFDAATCHRMVKFVNAQNSWEAAAIVEQSGDSFSSAIRSEYRSALAYTPPTDSEILNEFDEKIRRVVRPLICARWGRDFKRHDGTHFVRYSPGGYYMSHADAELDQTDRYFTVVCYLNEDFRGGHTSFPTLKFSVTPQIGKTIVFPATYIHRAEPVLKGRKYILVSWLVAPDPIRWI
jgi:hypothetical protein